MYTAEYFHMTTAERWQSLVVKTDSCWLWQGRPDSSGYGGLKINGKNVGAHRFGYELLVGKIPDGKQLDHLCRNRLCVNPEHLEPVTSRENTLRGQGRGARAARMTVCKNGHPLSGANLYIRPNDGKRRCRLCNSIQGREWRQRQKAKRMFGLSEEAYQPVQEA